MATCSSNTENTQNFPYDSYALGKLGIIATIYFVTDSTERCGNWCIPIHLEEQNNAQVLLRAGQWLSTAQTHIWKHEKATAEDMGVGAPCSALQLQYTAKGHSIGIFITQTHSRGDAFQSCIAAVPNTDKATFSGSPNIFRTLFQEFWQVFTQREHNLISLGY